MTALSLRLSSRISRDNGSAWARVMGLRTCNCSTIGISATSTIRKEYRRWIRASIRGNLLSVSCHETMVGAGEIRLALSGQNLSVNSRVADHHFQAFPKRVAADLAVFQIGII